MTIDNPVQPKRRRTWSSFGEVRRVPSEYEIVTHGTNWTLRKGRTAALEQNSSSPQNLWFLTYRDKSPLQAEDWDTFRDPDQLTYRKYVTNQDDAETVVQSLLSEYSDSQHITSLAPGWLRTLGSLFGPSRFACHGLQMCQSYLAQMAPSPYITNAAAFTAADMLRRVSLVAYRTRELQLAHPQLDFGVGDRARWETMPQWQPLRRAVEQALTAYDWGECFVAVNLVLKPTVDDVLLAQLGDVARANDDDLMWLLLGNLADDAARCRRWSSALARFAVAQDSGNLQTIERWMKRWAPRADEAVAGLADLLEALPERGQPATQTVGRARGARDAFLSEASLLVS